MTNRPLYTGLEQIVLLRRRLLFLEAQKNYGFQLLLRDPVRKFISYPEKYGKLSNSQYGLPISKTLSEKHQKLFARLRTDLDGFHDIEIKSLMWSGAAKIDLAIKRYFKDTIPVAMFHMVPPTPKYRENEFLKILKTGSSRSYFTHLHKKLR